MNLLNLFEDDNSQPGANYAEQLAYQIFKAAPELDATGAADEVLDYAYDLAVNDLGRKRAHSLFAYDEDFDSDLVSAYAHLQRQGVAESKYPWLDSPKKKKDQEKEKNKEQGVAEGDLDEGWKEKLAGAALAGTMALGTGGAHARVVPGADPDINRLTGKPIATQQVTDPAPARVEAPRGFSKEYLQQVVNGTHPRPMISVEKAQQLLGNMQEGEVYDLEKEYGYEKPKTQPKRVSVPSIPRDPADDGYEGSRAERRLRADQERVKAAWAAHNAKKGVAEATLNPIHPQLHDKLITGGYTHISGNKYKHPNHGTVTVRPGGPKGPSRNGLKPEGVRVHGRGIESYTNNWTNKSSKFEEGMAEGSVVQFPKKHKGDLEDTHSCVKCGGDLQGGTYMGHKVKVCMPCKQVYLPPNSGIDQKGNKIEEYGDTAKGQQMLTKVQKRAVDRVVSKKADTDPKYAKKNSDTAKRAWDRMTDLDESRMSELDAEYQDYKKLSPREFYNMYRITKQAWLAKYKSMLPQSSNVVQGSDLKTVAKADLGQNKLNLPAGYGDVVQPQKLNDVEEGFDDVVKGVKRAIKGKPSKGERETHHLLRAVGAAHALSPGMSDVEKDYIGKEFLKHASRHDKVKNLPKVTDEAVVGNRMSDMSVGSPKIVYKNGKAVGEIGIDHEASPGQGPYYMKHYETNTWYSGYDSKKAALADLKHVVDQMTESVAEADKKKDAEPEVRDVALQRAISRAKADFPTAGTGIEALAKGFMRSQDQDEKSFDQLRQAERKQDQMLSQISQIDQEQEQEIQDLEQQNSTLASRLQQLQSVNSNLEKKLAAMSGRRAEKKSNKDSAPVATQTSPAIDVKAPVVKSKTKTKTKTKAQPSKSSMKSTAAQLAAPKADPMAAMSQRIQQGDSSVIDKVTGQKSLAFEPSDNVLEPVLPQQQVNPRFAAAKRDASDVDPRYFQDVVAKAKQDMATGKAADMARADSDDWLRQTQADQMAMREDEKEVDYDDPRWDAMIKRVGQKAREQEKSKPVNIADLARRLAAIDASRKEK